jgi:hypothetical protein
MSENVPALRPTQKSARGGYRFIPSVFQFSGGVAAEPGHAIERVELRLPVPLEEGLGLVRAHLLSIGRPLPALCAFELRSPGQFSDMAFEAFNRKYVQTLDAWGVLLDDVNPVARTNVCPVGTELSEPSIHAFAYTIPSHGMATPGDFITAGGAEAPEDGDGYHDKIIRRGDTTIDGLREKLAYVRDEQMRRMGALGFCWATASQVNAYSRHDVGPLIYEELLKRGVARRGLTLHEASPPVEDCEFEMDAHSVTRQLLK